MEIYNPVKGMSEEEYIEECRRRFRSKMDDTRFVVTARMDQIAKRFHPKDVQAMTQLKMAISRLVRTKFDVRTIHFIQLADKDEVLRFLDGVEKLLESSK